jgi:hypothetical protein
MEAWCFEKYNSDIGCIFDCTHFFLGSERYSGGGWIRGSLFEAEYFDASRVQRRVNTQEKQDIRNNMQNHHHRKSVVLAKHKREIDILILFLHNFSRKAAPVEGTWSTTNQCNKNKWIPSLKIQVYFSNFILLHRLAKGDSCQLVDT